MEPIKYTDLLKENKSLKAKLAGKPPVKIHLMNNITVNILKDVLEFRLRLSGNDAEVLVHDYDTIIPDSMQLQDETTPRIIFWEICNYLPGIYYKSNLWSNNELDSFISKVKNDIDLVYQFLSKASIAFVNTFSASPFSLHAVKHSPLQLATEVLNKYLAERKPEHVHLVDINAVYQEISVGAATDLRMFNNSKTLHTYAFFSAYVNRIMPVIASVTGKAKKALIFDCDNSLWHGIIGEDGKDGIKMSAEDAKGIFFHQVQRIAVELSKQGIIIGLNSKNNPEDVDDIIQTHPDMFLKDEHIVIKKVNWTDKVSNLKQIAKDLNIGIDSLVFIDDSDFEINLVREQLPEVSTFQVPKALHDYPKMVREIATLFYNHSQTGEDLERVNMYKQEQAREQQKETFGNIDDYLHSLGIKINIFKDNASLVARTAQMTQKTNQFNLTTKRYTENDILHFITSPSHHVYVFEVSDKFGSYGITGLCITSTENGIAYIDSFLMSCRVLGRKIESSFLSYIIQDLMNHGITSIHASYTRTAKNAQVERFYENNGFTLTTTVNTDKQYTLNTASWENHTPDFISIENVENNLSAL